jgi:endoglucanase
LSDLYEKGSWDNNSWYDPEGKFDWSAVERFEISSEFPVSSGQYVWFDNIHVTNLDTAQVREDRVVNVSEVSEQALPSLMIAPNPVRGHATVAYELAGEDHVDLSIFSLTGLKILTLDKGVRGPGLTILTWNGCIDPGKRIGQGMYFCVLTTSRFKVSCKLLVAGN